MAEKLKTVFGADAEKLLEMQAKYEGTSGALSEPSLAPTMYAPVYLDFRARDISEWSGQIQARERFAVLLRTLVHSTTPELESCDFPGNDHSQTPGEDGRTISNRISTWVPLGRAHWEFGTDKKPVSKANQDYRKSTSETPPDVRSETTFVFVTSQTWPGKRKWIRSKEANSDWKAVRAYDASDLEQWLAQSVQGQVWFANEVKFQTNGVLSLETCWGEWANVTEPRLTPHIFDDALEHFKYDGILAKLSTNRIVYITADSNAEALAYIHLLFSRSECPNQQIKDRLVLFKQSGQLPKLLSKNTSIIPVIVSEEVQHEFAKLDEKPSAIIVTPYRNIGDEIDLHLKKSRKYDLQKALETGMGKNRDAADRLCRECGNSRTVLRRRLASLEAVRTPPWSMDEESKDLLIAIALLGRWSLRASADHVLVSLLTSDMATIDIEKRARALASMEDAPLWITDAQIGIVSKSDALFTLADHITEHDIDRFLQIADMVVSEYDPSIELPENQRWMASIHNKTREISNVLRSSICDTLVMLSTFEKNLFQNRFSFSVSRRIADLIKELLTLNTTQALEMHSDFLPRYAKAAPNTFLEVLEVDLETDKPDCLAILRPTDALFGNSPRVGLLRALERLAWDSAYLPRVAKILAQMSTVKIEDNLSNKPSNTLQSLFQSWLPQTTCSVEERIKVLDFLKPMYPMVFWAICLTQLMPGPKFGRYNPALFMKVANFGTRSGLGGVLRQDALEILSIE